MIRRYGAPPEAGRSYRMRAGVYAILPVEGGVLLTHQSEPWPEFQLPGGGIDPGESPIAALHREVLEETGWRIATPLRLGAYRRFTYMPEYGIWAEKLCHIYVARPVRSLGPPHEDGHLAMILPEHAAVLAVASPGDRAFLQDWLAGRFGSG